MKNSEQVLRNEEKAIYQLRALYRNYGYSQYKVSKFEEYDLYAHHKNFLVSDSVLTFTDTNGRLMALKPDVTLSIAKHALSEGMTVNKVYYNESVYRTSAASDGFREIMQTGLECIGHLDPYAEGEVIMLAMQSLNLISSDYLLDISHMGLIEGILEDAGVASAYHTSFLELIGSKNIPGLRSLGAQLSLSEKACDYICRVTALYLPLKDAVKELKAIVVGEKAKGALEDLIRLSDMMTEYGLSEHLCFDFSIVSDIHYYDGMIFKGFINGIPESLLSGGRYDRLLTMLGKKAGVGAIGFAVYLDRLERFGMEELNYDTDVLLVYHDDIDAKTIIETVRMLQQNGKTVRTSAAVDKTVRYRELIELGKGGMEILETND